MFPRARPASPAPESVAIDLFGFALGVGLAFLLDWRTPDLVWSLWLSSLVIGYTTLLTSIVRAQAEASGRVLHRLAGTLFLIVFFTVHFGGFHFVHSVFLHQFFPLSALALGGRDFVPGLSGYGEVFHRYWPWLLAAAVAERRSIWPPSDPTARAAVGVHLMQPYANVVRMHLLIFFFVGASFAGLHGVFVYTVVYAVYFWPWRRTPPVAVLGETAGAAPGTGKLR